MPKAKKKKPKIGYYKKKADGAFSKMIRERDGVCLANRTRTEKCESPNWLQCAHIHSRDYSATRLDPENALTLCRSCHMYFTNRPLEWEGFISGYEDDEGLWIPGILPDEHYYQMGLRAFAGARRLHSINWEEAATEWETRSKSGNGLPKMNWTSSLGT